MEAFKDAKLTAFQALFKDQFLFKLVLYLT